MQATVLGATLARQPFISGSAATNVVAANSEPMSLGSGLARSNALYGTHAIVADGYGSGSDSAIKFRWVLISAYIAPHID